MSKFAIFKTVKPGPWTEDGQITLNVDLIAAIEVEAGCGGDCTRVTITGGRTICVKGKPEAIRSAVVRQSTGRSLAPLSLFEEVFGRKYWQHR